MHSCSKSHTSKPVSHIVTGIKEELNDWSQVKLRFHDGLFDWLHTNIKSRWTWRLSKDIGIMIMVFENPSDAMLTKLTWA